MVSRAKLLYLQPVVFKISFMGILLIGLFIIVFMICGIALTRASIILKEVSHSMKLISIGSISYSALILTLFILILIQKTAYYPFDVYSNISIYYISIPTLIALLISFIPNEKLKKASMVVIFGSICSFILVHIWLLLGPSLTILGLEATH